MCLINKNNYIGLIYQYRFVICLTNVIGWKLNQLGLVNVTDILVDM